MSENSAAGENSAADENSADKRPLARVEVVILGQTRVFMCREGEEERLRAHALELEHRLQELGGEAADDEPSLLIAAALQMADELFEVHTEAEAAVAARESRLAAMDEARARDQRELAERLTRLAEQLESEAGEEEMADN